MERKLTAILSADVKGYSRLMGDDEAATVQTLTAYRELLTKVIQAHHGRVVDSPGDNMLAEFASVVDAVQGAIVIQQKLRSRNAQLPEQRKMEFRIGINVGDVIVEDGRLYGDGLNIAARIEGLAEAGGICISGKVFEEVESKLPLGYEYIGEQQVKNIAKPVRVYKVKLEAEAAAPTTREEPAPELPLPDKPSIAVLPFTNMSADPEQEYFSDGMTDDIITDLSKISGLFVIARNSTFTYKGQAVDMGEVGRRLGARYIVEGSVRKAGNRVRINVQLIEATTGGHVWAERYDRELKDIFALQDDVRQKVVRALEVKLTEREQGRVGLIPTGNLEAYDYFLRGMTHVLRFTKDTNTKAQRLFEKALVLDPEYAAAAAFLGFAYYWEWGFWNPKPQVLERAFEQVQRAVALDDSLPEAHTILGILYLFSKQPEQALAEGERAIALNPNYADGYAFLAFSVSITGKPEEAIELVQQALRLNPYPPFFYFSSLALAYYFLRRYEETITVIKRALALNPTNAADHAFLAFSYIESDQKREEARAEFIESLKLSPLASPKSLRPRLPYTDQAVLDRVLDSARKALATLSVRDDVSIVKARLSQYFHRGRTQDQALQ